MGLFLSVLLWLFTSVAEVQGYNVGICQPTFFLAAHFDVDAQELDITYYSPGPNHIIKSDPVAVFIHTQPSRNGYERYVNSADQLELDLKFSNGQVDGILLGLSKPAHVFGAQGTVSSLVPDSFQLHLACQLEMHPPTEQ